MNERIALSVVLLRQREAWQKGQRLRVEEFLDLYTHLQDSSDDILDLIYNEILLREEAGETITPEEYYRRFPALVEALRVQFEVEKALTLEDLAEPPGSTSPYASRSVSAKLPVLEGCELLDELGRGAMGIIYRGWQTAAKRPVAVKLLASDMPVGRVRVEAEAASRLLHPNIVQVFEVKEYEGRTALVLEYVEGGNLAEKLAGKPQPPDVAAHLVETLAWAMAYAHGRGVIHRDLKPSNVLLSCGPDEPLTHCVPKIGDFGLAKLVEGGQRLTATSDILGTPSYMAPEQTGSSSSTVGTPVDVYALGAILYECLTGRPPFLGQSVLDTLDQVRTQEPVAPSGLQPRIPHDLDIITLKCLHKQPVRRYGSARELAEDLRRFQEGKPIQARSVGLFERAWKWAQRRPAVATMVALGLLAFVTLVGVGLKVNQVLRQQRDLARDHADQLEGQLHHARRLLYTTQLLRVGSVWESDPSQGLRMLEDETACPLDLRCFSWGVLHEQCKRYRQMITTPDVVVTAACHPKETTLAMATKSGQVILLDRASGKEIATLRNRGPAVTALAFNHDGTALAACTSDGVIQVWENVGQTSGLPHLSWRIENTRLGALAWHPDNKTLIVASEQVTLHDARTGRLRRKLRGITHPYSGVAISPNGEWTACAGRDHAVKLWDARTGEDGPTLRGHTAPVTCLAFRRSSKTLITGSLDGTVRVWDTEHERETDSFIVATGPVVGLTLHPEGQVLAVAGAGPEQASSEVILDVQLWDLVSRRGGELLRGHPGGATWVAFADQGKTLITTGADRTLKLWDYPGRREQVSLRGHEGQPGTIALAGDGRTLAWVSKADRATGRAQEVNVLDLLSGNVINVFRSPGGPVQALALSRDGQQLAFAAGHPNEPAEVLIWEVRTGRLMQALQGHPSEVVGVLFRANGKELASAGRDGGVRIWDIATAKPRVQWRVHATPMHALHGSNEGSLALATEKAILVCEPERGEVLHTIETPTMAKALALSPEGKQVAWASDGVVTLVELGGESRTLTIGMKSVTSLAFSPDEQTLAVAGEGTGVKLWDLATAQERASLPRHRGGACFVGFAEDGQLLVSASGTQRARLWHRTRTR